MAKRKTAEVKTPPKPATKQRGVKKAKSASPVLPLKKGPVAKTALKASAAKAVKESAKKPVEEKKSRASRVGKAVEETAEKSPARPRRGAVKTAVKVLPPQPKTSVAKSTKTKKTATKSVPKVAAPVKATTKATKSKKAAGADAQESVASQSEESESGSSSETNAPQAASSSRKRSKVVKKEVQVKKPRVEIVIPPRHNRGSGVVLTTGQGDVGQLGLGPDVMEKSRPALVDQVKDVIDVVAGGMHTVCLTSKGQVYTFGCNDEGALGRDTSEEGSEFDAGMVELPGKVALVSAGDSHTAALLEDGRVFIWGTFRDSHGTMGLNSGGSQKFPVSILEGIPMKRIASGADHFVCLSVEGHVYTCGCAEQGQLGRVAEVFSNRGGRKGKNYLLIPQMVALGKGKKKLIIDDVWAGSYCTFIRAQETGYIHVFGLNNYNQLGLASQDARFQPEVSVGFKGRRWQSISCGQHHTVALDDDGQVYSLGRKEYGRLGMGADATDLSVPTLIPTLNSLKLGKFVEVACGEAVSLAVSESGLAYSWGMGTNGQLGNGGEDDLLEPTVIKSKQVDSRRVIAASAGGQHTILLAVDGQPEPESSSSKPN